MIRLFPAVLCLLLLAPVSSAQTTMEWIVLSIDWGDGVVSRGSLKATGFPSDRIVSPRDAASGLPTGRRQHKPVTLSEPPSGRPTGQRQKIAAPRDPASGQPTKGLTAPRDAASGLPAGKRQHKPIVITKPVDKATPILQQAQKTRRLLPRVVLRGRDTSSNYIIWELKNVRVSSYSVSGATEGAVATEKLTLVYESIQRVGG